MRLLKLVKTNSKKRGCYLHFLLFLTISISVPAFSGDYTEKVFNQAKELYKNGNYDSTVSLIKIYLKDHGKDSETEYIVPLCMEALARTGQYEYFNKLLSIYRRKFPESDYLPRIWYLYGVIKAKKQDYRGALSGFSEALKQGVSPELRKLTHKNISIISGQVKSLAELEKLSKDTVFTKRIREILHYHLLIRSQNEGYSIKTGMFAKQFLTEHPGSKYASFAENLIEGKTTKGESIISIGLLAPLSGSYSDIGKNVVRGIKLAAELHNSIYPDKINLIVKDTKGSPVETALCTRELIQKNSVPAIIGPVLSENSAVCAAMLMNRETIMITPTATDQGIAELDKNIFQLNVTLEALGSKIGEYSVKNLQLTEFAIISPMSEYGRSLIKGFRNTISKLGGQIVAEEYFEEGTHDFSGQFKNIREKLFKQRQSRLAFNNDINYDTSRLSTKDSIFLTDSTMRVGGLFIPAKSEDVVMIAPHVYFHNIQTQLLGSTGWHTPSTILDGKRYVNNAVISSNFKLDIKDKTWLNFKNRYKEKFGEEPDRVSAPLSYDAAQILFKAISGTRRKNDASEIRERLFEMPVYHGVAGPASFSNTQGTNKEVAIFKISNKKFINIE